MWILRLALRNALRNGRRSLLTAATVVIGVALFVLSASWMDGAFNQVFEDSTEIIGHVRVADPDFVAQEELQPLFEYLPDASALVAAAEATDGVVAAYPTVRSGVAVTTGEELGDVFGMATGAPTGFFERIGLPEALVDGRMPEGPDEWLVGARLAKKADATVGSEVVLFGQTQDGSLSPARGTCVGIVQAGHQLVDMQLFVPLETMQDVVDIGDGAIEVLVYADDFRDAAPVATAMKEQPAFADLTVQSWDSREPFNMITGMTGAIQGMLGAILVFLTALAIWNTMTMSVLERTDEIGVMRAMGLSRIHAVSLFVFEAVTIAAVGGALGVALGGLPSLWLESHGLTIGEDVVANMSGDYALSTTMYADFTVSGALRGFVLGLIMAFVGSFVPALRAAAIQPVDAMRHGR